MNIIRVFMTVLLLPCMIASAGSPLRITSEGDWKASTADVRKVLHSAALPLWREFPDRDLSDIMVVPQGGPIVLFKRGPKGEYTVKLNTRGRHWAQYAYQFSHEFCHILCNYREGGSQNKWFEESLCELASLYSLRRMAESWKTNPPYPNWKDYSGSLQSYAQNYIDKTKTPEDMAAWYRLHRKHLASNPTDREKNRILAVRLLPMFEKTPSLWKAVAHLNEGEDHKDRNFTEHMRAWHANTPRHLGPRIEEIANLLGVEIN